MTRQNKKGPLWGKKPSESRIGAGQAQITAFGASPKGQALMSAISAGMLPEVDGGWDTDAFDKFWDDFSKRVIITPLRPTNFP